MTLEVVKEYKRQLIAIEKFCFKMENIIKSVNINDPSVNVIYIRKAMKKYSDAAMNHHIILHHIWESGHII